ncbi:uncharacterized protein METZ01_LOCUS63727 [marine metagenome]|uniref:SnoaL-like domain-containing protein n=1 Tax=marine metagenome TaxID=408172 RepID=A0A381TAL1_9ZZZZ|tara:strand:- start:2261 stop:2674 length:414 start_codon:yes stop_codon:yes gene_type:complete
MNKEKTREFILGFFKAVNEGDSEKVLKKYYHPNIKYWIPGDSTISGFHNLESLGSVGFELLKAFPEGLKIEVETILIDDNFASVTAKGTAEFLDGVPYQNEYHYFLRFEEERIIEAREYMDTQKSAEMVKHANKIQE